MNAIAIACVLALIAPVSAVAAVCTPLRYSRMFAPSYVNAKKYFVFATKAEIPLSELFPFGVAMYAVAVPLPSVRSMNPTPSTAGKPFPTIG